ncbi:hypothetical protein J4437_00290 [Candidatus Woesearchaeota archaeon]|nr:hypothetical protein [Candidatus Woesearchaeota archaeon]
MIHINSELKKQGLLGKLKELTLPQIYVAPTISGFLEDRKNITTTSFLDVVGYTLGLRAGGFHFYGAALIFLNEVQYFRDSQSLNLVYLKDSNCTLGMGIHDFVTYYESIKEQGINNGDKVQLAGFIYDPTDNRAELLGLIKIWDYKCPNVASHSLSRLVHAFDFS